MYTHHIYIYVYICIYVHMHIYIYRERERERDRHVSEATSHGAERLPKGGGRGGNPLSAGT